MAKTKPAERAKQDERQRFIDAAVIAQWATAEDRSDGTLGHCFLWAEKLWDASFAPNIRHPVDYVGKQGIKKAETRNVR